MNIAGATNSADLSLRVGKGGAKARPFHSSNKEF
jgi:hypothetical protein